MKLINPQLLLLSVFLIATTHGIVVLDFTNVFNQSRTNKKFTVNHLKSAIRQFNVEKVKEIATYDFMKNLSHDPEQARLKANEIVDFTHSVPVPTPKWYCCSSTPAQNYEERRFRMIDAIQCARAGYDIFQFTIPH